MAAVTAGLFSHAAIADLQDLIDAEEFQSEFEEQAARAVQATYDRLVRGGCNPTQVQEGGQCTGTTFSLFENVRELVATANQLSGSQALRQFSLNLDQESLGFALRWNAAEELAAQGSSATEFSNSQLGSLAGRIAALRFASRGRGGGASADSEGDASRWGGFVNGSYGYGSREDSTDPFQTTGLNGTENGFDFDGQEITLGADYRVSNSIVVGAQGGYTQREVDFDSSVSIVDGGIDVEGQSLIAFAIWEGDRFYASGSVGGQWMDYELTRRITYPSLNPLIPSIDVTNFSETDSTAFTAGFEAGFSHNVRAFGFELFVGGDYQDITIDAFREEGGNGFELTYQDQDIKSFDVAAGLRLSYVFRPRFGVFRPYLHGSFHKELENASRAISAVYLDGTPNSVEDFALPTDPLDDEYLLATAGFSVVFARGLQGYFEYQEVFELDLYDDQVIAGGFRFVF